jgi:hypothetical protein
MRKSRLVWYLKQLLPLTYWTTYIEDGQRRFCIWRMWLGRSFQIIDVPVGEDVG